MTPPPRRLIAGHQAARQPDRRHDVQVPIVLPLVVGRLHDRLVAAGAGIVDQDVGAAELLLGRGDQCGAALGGGDVAGHRRATLHAVRCGDLGPRRLEPVGVAGGDDDMRTLGGEALGDGEADADAAAGDHGDLVAQTRDP